MRILVIEDDEQAAHEALGRRGQPASATTRLRVAHLEMDLREASR